MRVVAGRWRGRRLASPRGTEVRPTADRVKEAMFSILGGGIEGAVVLDLCCGSGGLGIEALSRGAGEVLFVDSSGRSLDCTRRNLEACGAAPESYRLTRAEAAGWLETWLQGPQRPPSWYLLADPPYQSDAGRAILDVLGGADPAGLVLAVIEHRTGEDLPEPASGRWTLRQRSYGESELVILQPA